MGNIVAKGIKLKKKEFAIKTRLTYPKGIKAYILKRDGRTQSWITLAIFDNFGVTFDAYRSSETLEFAVADTERFEQGSTTRTMREVAAIATHVAHVIPDGESVVYAIRTGDEFQPYFLDFSWKFYVKQVGDKFDPTENI